MRDLLAHGDPDSLYPNPKEVLILAHIVLAFLSVALFLAVFALVRERRLRLALQSILKRLIDRWRSNANTTQSTYSARDDRDSDDGRL